MKPRDRQAMIAELVGHEGRMSVDDLAARFHVSTETIRRDLGQLAEDGVVQKVHGGAKRPRLHAEGSFQERMTEDADAKRAIALKLRDVLQTGDTVFMDTGSTTLICAEAMADVGPVTLVTNSVAIAQVIAGAQNGSAVFLVGGQFSVDNRETYGPMAIAQLGSFRADHAVLSAAAIDSDGIMDSNFEEAQVARAMIEQARRLVIVADASKFGRTAAFKVCDLNEIDMLITDQKPGPEIYSALSLGGVEVR